MFKPQSAIIEVSGVVSEWSKERAWKARSRDNRLVGSNPTYSASFSTMEPTPAEIALRDKILQSIVTAIRASETIRLPDFDPASSQPAHHFALQSVGIEANAFGGTLAEFRYQFEGEEDLLHLIVTRLDKEPVSVEEAQKVAKFLFPQVPPGLLWLKPGTVTQHFYLGHDLLLEDASQMPEAL
jgi:hypothetical protein